MRRNVVGDDATCQRDGKGKSSLLAPRSRAHSGVTRSVAFLPAAHSTLQASIVHSCLGEAISAREKCARADGRGPPGGRCEAVIPAVYQV